MRHPWCRSHAQTQKVFKPPNNLFFSFASPRLRENNFLYLSPKAKMQKVLRHGYFTFLLCDFARTIFFISRQDAKSQRALRHRVSHFFLWVSAPSRERFSLSHAKTPSRKGSKTLHISFFFFASLRLRVQKTYHSTSSISFISLSVSVNATMIFW